LRDGVQEVAVHADRAGALFQSLLPKMLQDTDDEEHLTSHPGIDCSIRNAMMDQLSGPKRGTWCTSAGGLV